jgi:hypothetical protein
MGIEEGRTECALLRAPDGTGDKDRDNGGNRITRVDRALISRYFDVRSSPASLAKSERPRWRRRWIVGATLPATLHTVALPRPLESKLSPLDAGHERLLVGSDVLCIESETLRISDVMHNAGVPPPQDTAHLLLDTGPDAGVPATDSIP